MVDGIRGNGKVDGQSYTMQSLNINPDSRVASIFNKIDISDGTVDNFLSQDQVCQFKKTYLENMSHDELKDLIGGYALFKLSESYLQQFTNKDGTYNLNELSSSLLNALNQDYKLESKIDETKLAQEALKNLTGEDFSTKETKKILDVLGFQQKHLDQNNKKDEIDGNAYSYVDIVNTFYPDLVEKHGLPKAVKMFKDTTGIDIRASVQPDKIKVPEEIDGAKRKESGFEDIKEKDQRKKGPNERNHLPKNSFENE